MFDEIDADDTGDIDYQEFKELARRWMHILRSGVPETSAFSNKRHQTRIVSFEQTLKVGERTHIMNPLPPPLK